MKLLILVKVALLTFTLTACGGSSVSTESQPETKVQQDKKFNINTQVFNFAYQAGIGQISAFEVSASSTATTPVINKVIYDLLVFPSAATNKFTVNYQEPVSSAYPIQITLSDGNTKEQLAVTQMEASLANNSKLIFAFGNNKPYMLKTFDKPKFETDDNKSDLVVINLSNMFLSDSNIPYSIQIDGNTIEKNVKGAELSSIISLNKYEKNTLEIAVVGSVKTATCNISQADIDNKKNSMVIFYDLANTNETSCSIIQIF